MFFLALSLEPMPYSGPLKGSITNFINRFAITIFEEGVFIHVSNNTQKIIVYLLLEILKDKDQQKWQRCTKHIHHIIRIVDNAYRGRIGSVVARHSLDKRPVSNVVEDSICTALYINNLEKSQKDVQMVKEACKNYLPIALPLLSNGCKYKECEELLKVIYMNACVSKLIPQTAIAEEFTSDTIPNLDPVEITRTFLDGIGTFDCHVKGKQNASAWYEFTQKGCRVENMSPVVIFGLSYKELEANYVAGKEADIGKRKLNPAIQPSKKCKTNNIPDNTITFSSECDLFTPGDDDYILGFKNGTTCAKLNTNLGSLCSNTRVFIKVGEPYDQCLFSKKCFDLMSTFQMQSCCTEIAFVKINLEWWNSYGTRTDRSNEKKWSVAMMKNLSSKYKKSVYGNYMPFIIQDEFIGERLTYVKKSDERLKKELFGKSLLETMLFSKYFGIKDFGPYNVMINPHGSVLQVDINYADPIRLMHYNKKGLQTSHRFLDHFINAAREYAVNNPCKVADFLIQLTTMPTTPGVSSCIFTTETIKTLKEGDSSIIINEL